RQSDLEPSTPGVSGVRLITVPGAVAGSVKSAGIAVDRTAQLAATAGTGGFVLTGTAQFVAGGATAFIVTRLKLANCRDDQNFVGATGARLGTSSVLRYGFSLAGTPSDDTVFAATVQVDNKIVLTGRAQTAAQSAFVVTRLTTDGKPDASFGT